MSMFSIDSWTFENKNDNFFPLSFLIFCQTSYLEKNFTLPALFKNKLPKMGANFTYSKKRT